MSLCYTVLAQRDACKQSLGLKPESCYPAGYAGECGELEHALRKCLASANRRLQQCLRKKHVSELGCERAQTQT